MVNTVASSSSNKKFYWKDLLHLLIESYIFSGLVVMLLVAIVFIRFRETGSKTTLKITSKVSLKQPRVIEIVKWHQPICVIPGKDVLPCLPSQEKVQIGYQHSRAEKSDEGESGQELADFDRIPEYILKTPEMDIKWQFVTRNEPNSLIRLTRSISPNIPDRTRPSRVYVTKVLDLPVTPVSITHGCLPNDLRLCADYQPNFPLKIIKKEEDELIQSNDQNSTIKMHEKTYLAVPPKVKISWLNKENNSKIIDQLTSYTDHESKINTTESTQNHKPKINTTKSTNNIADKRRNKVNYQPISYMNHDKLSYQHISDMKINTIKPIDHQPEISTTEPIENRRKYKVNYSKITDSLKYEMNFSDNIEHSKYIPVEHAFGSFHDTYQINQ